MTLDLACGGTNLTRVILSGACNVGDATSPDDYLDGSHQQYVYVQPIESGPCHIQLVFATGFTFSTDVHFSTLTDDSDPQCTCQYVQADQTTIAVNNPTATCVDAAPPEPPPTTSVLASGLSGAMGLAVDGTTAYLTDAQGVFEVSTTGGAFSSIVLEQGATDIAARSGTAFWTVASAGNVFAAGHTHNGMLVLGQSNPTAIAVDASNVYFTNAVATGGAVGSVVKVGIESGTVTTLASGLAGPEDIAVDATSVYWTDLGAMPGAGSVLKVPLSGGPVTTLASARAAPTALALDGTNVYWVEGSVPGAILKVPVGGGAPVTLAGNQDDPVSIATDGTSVYWTARGVGLVDGAVVKVAATGGAPVTLAPAQPTPGAIAIDATSVYWLATSSGSDGSLMKLTPR